MSSLSTRGAAGIRILVFVLLVAALGALAASPAHADERKPVVKVMTYNMDAGTDFGYLFTLGFEEGVGATIQEIMTTDFPGRAAALAKKIAVEQPDLVGLQEVTLWELTVNGARVQLIADQLALLLEALEANGQHYEVAIDQDLTDLSAGPIDPDGTNIRFLDRNAILVRKHPGPNVEVSRFGGGIYEARATFLGVFTQLSGWLSVDAKVGPDTVRFFTTHLDTATEQTEQGDELIDLMDASPYPAIVAGDFNSDASGAGLGPDQTLTAGTIAAAGYTEVWGALHPQQTGFTWPLFYEDLLEDSIQCPGPERIDLVFAKGVQPLTIKRVGLLAPFASDHAGVVSTLLVEK